MKWLRSELTNWAMKQIELFFDLSGSDVKTTEHRYLFELENVIG